MKSSIKIKNGQIEYLNVSDIDGLINILNSKQDEFSILKIKEGGTGKRSISEGNLLIGDSNGNYAEISKNDLKEALMFNLNYITSKGEWSDQSIRIKDKIIVQGGNTARNKHARHLEIDNSLEDQANFILYDDLGNSVSKISMQRGVIDQSEIKNSRGSVIFSGRVSGKNGVGEKDFVTKSQLDSMKENIPSSSPVVKFALARSKNGLNFSGNAVNSSGHFILSEATETIYLITLNTTECYPNNVWDNLLPNAGNSKGKILTLIKNTKGSDAGCGFNFSDFHYISGKQGNDLEYIKLISDGNKWIRIA